MTSSSPSETSDETPRGATAMMEALIAGFRAESDEADPQITLGELFDRMEERAFGLLMLLLALPCCLPFVYLLPQIVALPMLLLSAQMAAGRTSPWLPQSVRRRSMSANALGQVVGRARRYLAFAEYLARPRLTALTGHFGSRFLGALLLVPTASILVPLPLTNTVPGIGVAIVSVGLIERDGLLVIAGLVVGLFWVSALLIGGQAAISALFALIAG